MMRELLSVLCTLAASLLLVAAAVFAGHDRSTFVPAPEAVAESFAREVATRRFDIATRFLSSTAPRPTTAAELAAHFEGVVSLGKINTVEAEGLWMRESHAAARATIAADEGEVVFDVHLVREKGLWKIAQLSDLVR